MKKFNIFYLFVLVLGFFLFLLLIQDNKLELSFFGFAESNETEINYNYPVVVENILVQEGEEVDSGQVLMLLTRRKSKDVLDDQQFRITELKAEERIWRLERQNSIKEKKVKMQNDTSEISLQIKNLENELKFQKSLTEGLVSIETDSSSFNPQRDKISQLKLRRSALVDEYESEKGRIEQELSLGYLPYRAQIKRLEAQQEFEASQQIQEIELKAPSAGLIGNIFCKEEEHIPSYKTLLSFYEPHSTVVRGYVHEDLTLQVHLGDLCKVSSLKDETLVYTGTITGLGSRIIEIPQRLRKVPTVKTYGREILVNIPRENVFLQKEKVSIEILENE